jgi:hypothetical protein
MHQLYRRDLDHDLVRRHLDVVDHLLHHLVHHPLHLVNDMDLTMLVRHLYVVGNFLFQFPHLLVELHLVVLQNLDEQNLVELLPFLDEVHLFQLVVVVGVELRHRLRKDYFQDEVDVELRHLLRMDCYLDVVQLAQLVLHQMPVLLLLLLLLPLLHRVQAFQHRVMPSVLQDQRRVRRQVLQLILDLLRQSSLRRQSSSLQLS